MRKWSLRLVLLVVFITVMLWASRNSAPIRLTFLDYETMELPLSVWVMGTFVLGILTGAMLNAWTNTRLRLTARRATREADATRRDLDRYKAATDPEQDASPPAVSAGS